MPNSNKPSVNPIDHRKYLRLPKPYRIEGREIKFPIPKDLSLDSTCSDISAGGLCVESNHPFDVGSKMQVKVHIPSLNKHSPGFFKVYENDADQYLQGITEITWCRPSGGRYLVGMRFDDVDSDDTRALSSLINKTFRDLERKQQAVK